jgi:hypothetical protein
MDIQISKIYHVERSAIPATNMEVMSLAFERVRHQLPGLRSERNPANRASYFSFCSTKRCPHLRAPFVRGTGQIRKSEYSIDSLLGLRGSSRPDLFRISSL